MADIKEKVEMELKPFDKICDEVQDTLESMLKSVKEEHPETILAVAKTLGEIVDIKKDIVEMCYKKQIMEAMEDSEYGEDYTEDGVMRRGYRGQRRDSKGRYMYTMTPDMYYEHTPEYYRDMDRDSHKVMYYTDSSTQSNNRGYNSEGRVERMRRNYTDTKDMSSDSQEDRIKSAKKLDEALKTMEDEITQMIKPNGKMPSNEEKTIWKKYLQKWESMIPN